MCLYTISAVYEKPTNKVEEVYKAFYYSTAGIIRFPMQGGYPTIGKWMKAKGPRLPVKYGNIDGSITYPSGFHAYVSERACKEAWGDASRLILKVKFRKVVARGKQDGLCIVAKEMYIPKSELKKALKKKGFDYANSSKC